MKNLIPLLLLLVACNASKQQINVSQSDLAITNITLIDGTGSEAQENMTIFIKDGRILNIGRSEDIKADSIIDGSGKYLIPGLFESHFHFPHERKRDLRQLIHFGVTSVFNTGSSHTSYDMMKELIRLEQTDSIVSPHIFYTSYYVTIPGAQTAKNIASDTGILTGNIKIKEDSNIYLIKSEDDIPDFVSEAKNGGASAMKLTIEDGPAPPIVDRISQEYVDRIVDEAHKQNLKVFAHISDTVELKMGLLAGVDGFVHSITSKDWWGASHQGLVKQMVADSIPMVTTNMIIKSGFYPFNPQWRKSEEWQVYEEDQITDIEEFEPVFKKSVEPMLKHYLGLKDFNIKQLKPYMENFKRLKDLGVLVVAGSDVGALAYILPGHSLHEELQLLQLGGMQPTEIIQCATLNAAKMLEVDADYGSIEKGKVADMILLDKNPLEDISNTLSINTVFKRGKKQPRIKISKK